MNAIFVMLAGVLFEDPPAPPAGAGLRPGVASALRLLARLDYRVVVLAPCQHDRRHAGIASRARTAALLEREGLTLAAFVDCARTDGACCGCAPAPGQLCRAAERHGIVLARSWLLAAHAHQMQAGSRAGCRSVLIGAEPAWCAAHHAGPWRICPDPYAAAVAIAQLERRQP